MCFENLPIEFDKDGNAFLKDGVRNPYEYQIRTVEEREAKLKEVGKTIRMPGFRAGKVPLKMLKQRYGKAILGEVLETAVNETSAKAMEDKKLQPAIQP